MAKYLLKDAVVIVNGVDLSDHAFSIDTPDTKEQVDVSGFNAAGNREYLPGQRDQTITVGFLQDFDAGEVHKTLQPLYESGSVFTITVKNTSASPQVTFGGSAALYEYNGLSGQLNARGEVQATFRPASNNTWSWGTA